ncbi:MAG TPA: methyltransferase domain-containing protein [Acidimicrobiales bacterium]|nr:methyltransferase domain-containing protein [Acidimicrobiales bacterium]
MHNRVEPDLAPVARLYGKALEQHGQSAMAVGWRTEESQRLRFEKLLSVVDPRCGDRIDVNDLGCGYGALLSFLEERQVPIGTFFGYDISEEMLTVARKRASTAGSEFIASSRVTQRADYSFASGIFNVKLDCDDRSWTSYVEDVIRNLAEQSRVGFAFNLLSTYSDYQEQHLFYGDPLHWFDWCKRNVAPWVTLLHDYPLFEWTITVKVAG